MQTIAHFIFNFLVNSAWQIVLIAAVAGLCSRIVARASATYQHYIWVASLVFCVAVPVFSAMRAPSPASSLAGDSVERQTPFNDNVASPTLTVSEISGGRSRQDATSDTAPGWSRVLRTPSRRIPLRTGFVILAAALYLAFILFRLIRFFVGLHYVRKLAASSTPSELSPLVESVSERCRLAFGLPPIPILCSPKNQTPATVGGRRPIIVLPNSVLKSNDVAMLESVIGHEMAHIRRRDFGWNLIYELLYLSISFHPAAALVKRRIARTRELACDELVTERLLGAFDYARALVIAAGRISGSSRRGYTLGVFDADNLEERVMKLTETKSRRSARAGKAILASSAILLLLSVAAASAYSLNTGPPVSDGLKGAKQQEKAKNASRRHECL
jgi:beta-lactamase regulating signal transducer with metallopeptidase domain